ncbi:MAG: glycosyltransferase family 39 protein [bacterium]
MKVERTPQYFLTWLLFVSIFARVVLAFIYVRYPDIPVDMCYYVWAAKMLLTGEPLYKTLQENGILHPYGPLCGTVFAVWITLFKEKWVFLNFPSIIFDCLIIVIIFYIIKELVNEKVARFGSIFYAFSYLPLITSGAFGNDDQMYLFFMLLSIYLLIKHRFSLGMVSFGITLGFGVQMVPVLPAIAYYLYRKFGIKGLLKYFTLIPFTLFLILIPFYFNSGLDVLYPYSGKPFSSGPLFVNMLSPLNFIRVTIAFCINAIHYLSTHTVIPKEMNPIPAYPHSHHPLNLFFNQVAAPVVLLFGVIGIIWYMFRFKIENREIELVRNSFLWIFGALIFSRCVTDLYFNWLLPSFLILILFKEQIKFVDFKLKKQEILGIILTFIGLLNTLHISAQEPNLSSIDRVRAFLTPILVPLGTYLMLYRTKISKSWALLMFGFTVPGLKPAIMLFKPFLVRFIPEIPISYGTYLSYFVQYSLNILGFGDSICMDNMDCKEYASALNRKGRKSE